MKRILVFVLCILVFILLPACEQELDLSLLLISSSDTGSAFGTVSEQDAATHLLIIDEDSEYFGVLSPYIGKYTASDSVSYACHDGYIPLSDGLRVSRCVSSSDLALSDPLWLRTTDSAKLRISPSADSEALLLIPSDEIYPVSAVSFTDTLYYAAEVDGSTGYVRWDAAQTSGEQAELEFYSVMSTYMPVGAQITIIDNGQILSSYAWGLSDIESGTDMTVDTTIRTASLSKVLFCISALRLQDDGIVDIDANIGTYWGVDGLKNSRYPDNTVSLRTILSHTSSVRSISDYPDADSIPRLMTDSKFLVSSEKTGTRKAWRYNNFAVGIGGATLEIASGRTMQDYVTENIFTPMDIKAAYSAKDLPDGCTNAVLYSSNGVNQSDKEALHVAVSDTPGDNSRLFEGGLHISSRDYAKLLVMLMNDGEYEGVRILSEESVAEIETPCFEVYDSSQKFSQCLILRKSEMYGRSIFYHTGNAYGTIAMASYDPESGDGVVIITTGMDDSTDKNGIYKICADVSEVMYTEIL